MQDSHELGEDLVGERAVLLVDEAGVDPAELLGRGLGHKGLLLLMGLQAWK